MTNKEAIKELRNIARFNYTLAPPEVFTMAIEALKDQRPHGEWIPVIGCDGRTIAYKCKTCGWFKPHDIMPFCENCGADMRKKVKRE